MSGRAHTMRWTAGIDSKSRREPSPAQRCPVCGQRIDSLDGVELIRVVEDRPGRIAARESCRRLFLVCPTCRARIPQQNGRPDTA